MDSPCSYPSVWKVLLYESLPEVILFKIERRMDKSEVLMKSLISVDFKIDLQSYTTYKHEANTKYDLAAVVCHEASTKRFGHFITHLRTGADSIKTIDDDRLPKVFKLDTLFRLNAFQSTVYMVMYFKKNSQNEKTKIIKEQSHYFDLSSQQQQLVERVWFGLHPFDMTSEIDHSDVLTTAYGFKINKLVVNTFLNALTLQECFSQNRSFCSFSADLMVAVRNKEFRNMEFRHLLISENFLNLDTALFPIYHTDDEHWTIASVYPKSKRIVHINSKRNDRAAETSRYFL